MSNVYLVTLLISNATGHVESIKAVETVTQGSCMSMARQIHTSSQPVPEGYELKFTCGSREALEGAVADNQCRVIDEKSTANAVATSYACEPNLKTRVVGWVRSVL